MIYMASCFDVLAEQKANNLIYGINFALQELWNISIWFRWDFCG
jgi:hypothetical protein